jgi:hypothetical protein
MATKGIVMITDINLNIIITPRFIIPLFLKKFGKHLLKRAKRKGGFLVMVSLKDVNYEDSRVQMNMKLNKKEKIEDLLSLDIDVCFQFGFSKIESTIVWTQEDINILEKQIMEIPNQSNIGLLTTIEPDLSFTYYIIPNQEEIEDFSDKEIVLFITLDSGHINNNMGTETGPTLKIITTYREMKKWISNIKTAFLR